MRELLFRGFHPCDGLETIVLNGTTIQGKWIEGLYGMEKGKIFPEEVSHYIITQEDRCFPMRNAVIPETVGQYTGLTDSSGQKVFESDILKFTDRPNDYEWTGRIEFGNPNGGYTWGYQIVHLSGPKPNIDTLCWFDMEEGGAYSEVIGTIFDEEAQHDN